MINGFRQEALYTDPLAAPQNGDVVKGFANSGQSSSTPSFLTLFDALDSAELVEQSLEESMPLTDTAEADVVVDSESGLDIELLVTDEIETPLIEESVADSDEVLEQLLSPTVTVETDTELLPENDELTQAELSAELATTLAESVIPTVQTGVSPASITNSATELKEVVANSLAISANQSGAQLTTQAPVAPTAAMLKFADMGANRDSTIAAVANDALQTVAQNVRSEQSTVTFKATVDKQMTAQQMGQQLSSMIADKVSVQVNAKTPVATIRLDPPDLGKIDLIVKVDNDKLQVQINASSQATRESIQQTSDRLRNELINQNFLNVEVTIADGEGDSRYSPDADIEEEFIFNNESQIGFDESDEGMSLDSELARA